MPTLITTDEKDWRNFLNLRITLYIICLLYVAVKPGNFIARNTDNGETNVIYQHFYIDEYARILHRVTELLLNGAYRYQLLGLLPLVDGIPRKPKTYATSGSLGSGNYAERQLTNPEENFSEYLHIWKQWNQFPNTT